MLFVPVQVKTRWEQGFRALYAEAGEVITAKATQNAGSAAERENQAMACRVHVAGAKNSMDDLKIS